MTLTRRTRLPPRRLDVRCVLWRVPRAACRAHDRRERLSRCVLVVSGFAWIEGVVLDESLQPEMCNYYAWRKCAFKRQKSTPPVLAESTQPVLAVEQAHEVKDAESTQSVLAESTQPALPQFSPPTPVSSVSPWFSDSPWFSVSPLPPVSPLPSGSPMTPLGLFP